MTFADFFLNYQNKSNNITNQKYFNLKYLFDTNTHLRYLTNAENTIISKLSIEANGNVKQYIQNYSYINAPNYNFV